MAARKFFRAGGVQVTLDRALDACIELGLIFKCSPFEFIGRDPAVIADIYRRTIKIREEAEREDG